MLTDKELLEMKKVAMKAYPFPDDYGKVFKFDEDRYNEILESNKQLFIDAINHLPNLIDELLAYRNSEIEETESDYEEIENEADEMTIYEGDVYITNNNNYGNGMSLEEVRDLIDKQLRIAFNLVNKECCKNE